MSAEPGRKSAYLADLRWRVVWQRIAKEFSFRKIPLNLNIPCNTAQTTFKLFEQTGEVSPWGQPIRKEMRCLSDADEIVGLILESMYLQELCQEIHSITSKQVSAPLCVDCLQGMGSPGKRYKSSKAKMHSFEG